MRLASTVNWDDTLKKRGILLQIDKAEPLWITTRLTDGEPHLKTFPTIV